LRKMYIVPPILLLFLFIAGVSLAQDIDSAQNSTGLADNTGLNESLAPPVAMPDDSAAGTTADNTADNTANASAPNLKYIWSIMGIEDDKVMMALDQDGSDLFGQAKYEPDSGDAWNGNVAGSITGNQVDLTITAQKGTDLESIRLNGAFADEAISGKFTKISGGKIISRGDFNAMWISDDLSTYEPAKVTEAAPQSATAPAQTVNTSPSTTDQSATGQSAQPAVQTGGKTQYVDVHKYAEQYEIGGDLSGVPPGMGGTGGLS
jgi:hypothetical protein